MTQYWPHFVDFDAPMQPKNARPARSFSLTLPTAIPTLPRRVALGSGIAMNSPSNLTKGLEGVVAATTRLSDGKGDVGELIYAGYNINELAGKVSFEEVVYLLHHNHLPNRAELDDLKSRLASYRDLPKGIVELLKTIPRWTPPMSAIRTAISALGCFDEHAEDTSMDANRDNAMRLIAQIPIVTAYFHRIRQRKSLLAPDPQLGEAANFLYLIDGEKPSTE